MKYVAINFKRMKLLDKKILEALLEHKNRHNKFIKKSPRDYDIVEKHFRIVHQVSDYRL